MLSALGGFLVGLALALIPTAYAIGQQHGQKSMIETIMAVPKAFGVIMEILKNQKGGKHE